jgi:hypothetical protein
MLLSLPAGQQSHFFQSPFILAPTAIEYCYIQPVSLRIGSSPRQANNNNNNNNRPTPVTNLVHGGLFQPEHSCHLPFGYFRSCLGSL